MRRILLVLLLAGSVPAAAVGLRHLERALIGEAATAAIRHRHDLPVGAAVIEDMDLSGASWSAGIRIGARRFLVTGRSSRALGPLTLALWPSDIAVDQVLAVE